jgi:hypothetical protein
VHLGVAAIRRIQGLLGLARQRGAALNDDACTVNDRTLKGLPTRAATTQRAELEPRQLLICYNRRLCRCRQRQRLLCAATSRSVSEDEDSECFIGP